jgi:hypothetical protein
MDVLGRLIRVQNQSFDVCRAEMEHPRLTVIDPNDGMIVMLAHAKKFPFGNLRDMGTSERGLFDERARDGGAGCRCGRLAHRPTEIFRTGAAIHWSRAQ